MLLARGGGGFVMGMVNHLFIDKSETSFLKFSKIYGNSTSDGDGNQRKQGNIC